MFINTETKQANAAKRQVIQTVTKVYAVGSDIDKDVSKALKAFLNTNETRVRFGNYFIDGNKLIYKAMVQEKRKHLDKVQLQALLTAIDAGKAVACDLSRAELVALIKDKEHAITHYNKEITVKQLRENVIAIKLVRKGETLILGNSSALDLIGRRVSFGRERLNRSETDVQLELSKHIAMLPFSVFDQASLDINTLDVIAQGGAETVTRKYETGKQIKDKVTKESYPEVKEETVHFTGASVFNVAGQCFLFDIDRREIDHKVFNPFLVKLPVSVKSIAQAYEVLKPNEVLEAEKLNLNIKRQGEWFFIPVDSKTAKHMETLSNVKSNLKRITLRAGNNRPNDARGIELSDNGKAIPDNAGWGNVNRNNTVCYVTGKVSHRGREHADLILKGWYRAIPNTAQESFTITGDID